MRSPLFKMIVRSLEFRCDGVFFILKLYKSVKISSWDLEYLVQSGRSFVCSRISPPLIEKILGSRMAILITKGKSSKVFFKIQFEGQSIVTPRSQLESIELMYFVLIFDAII